ncbi:MAG: LamB/YcsF family protein, partial [Gammaproteobacteria bacterium]
LILEANTLCVHGDNSESIAAIRSIREAIQAVDSN